MNRTKHINNKLQDKMNLELSDFYNKLLTLEPKQIIEVSYEKVAKEMDLLTYLKYREPDELVKLSNNIYFTKTQDSLKISNGYH